ncbi:MAG: oligosaccharide flippase family protein [Solirubrobacterales bacterium]|nr:oligosaccharide flippase family protein [Solirubrobacterales bacterium]
MEPSESRTEARAPVSPGNSELAIRGGANRVVGYALGVLVSLGTAAVLVRHLGVPNFGRFVTVTALIALVGGVTEAGIYVYGIREFGARNEPDRGDVMANLLAMRLTLSIVGISLAACFAVAVGYREALVLGTLVAGVGLLVQVVADVLSISLQAQLRLGRLTMVDLSRRVIVLLLVGSLALLGAGLLPFLAASAVAGSAALALLARMVHSSIKIRMSFDLRAWKKLFGETSLYAMAMSIGAVYFYVTVLVMSLIASSNQTGLFATSFRVIQVALGIPLLLLTAIFPLMAREHNTEETGAGDMVGKVFTVSLIGGVWMSLVMALGASFIIDVIAGGKAQGAVPVLRIQGVVLTASFISTSSALALISLRRYRPLIIASSSALALNIALGLLLVPALGARGGALADVITETLVACGLTAVVMRAVSRHQIRAARVPAVLLAAGLAASVWLVPVGSVARVILATVIYFTVLLLAGAIPAEVTDAGRRLWMLRKPQVAAPRSR